MELLKDVTMVDYEVTTSKRGFDELLERTNKRHSSKRLDMCHNPNLGLTIKVRACKCACRNPTLAKCGGEAQHLEKVRIWSPPRLLNVQSSIARPKTPCIEVFLMSLERS